MKKFVLSMAGAATVLASAITLIDYASRKSQGKNACVGKLVFGVVGSLAGTALVVACEKATPRKELVLDDMISDEDVALMHTNISEVLGAEHTEQ